MTLDATIKANNGSVQGRAKPMPGDDGGIYGNVMQLLVNMSTAADRFIPPSYFPGARDMQLRRFWKHESIMAGGIYTMTSRVSSLDHDILSEQPRKKKEAQDLLKRCEFEQGFHVFTQKVVQDVLTQDNGAFVELVGRGRADRPLIGPVTDFHHIDSAQCYRTFNPEYPVLYQNPQDGTLHKLHKTRVAYFSQMTLPDEQARGIGFCAVSRALQIAQYIRDVMQYKAEKVGGRFTRALGYGKGFRKEDLKAALEINEQTGKAAGFLLYRGIPFILPPGGNMVGDVSLGMLDLASLGDGFVYQDEITTYVYILALAFGTDARDFWPATVSGATKGDAAVQNMKARGKGYADIIQALEFLITTRILQTLSKSLQFIFDFVDDEQDEQEARIHETRMRTISAAKRDGIITPEEARMQAIHFGILAEEALTANPTLTEQAAPANAGDAETTDALDPNDVTDDGTLLNNESKAAKYARWRRTEKAIQSTRLNFESKVEDLLAQVQAGNVTRVKFSAALRGAITVACRQAYLDGLTDGGVGDGVLEAEDESILNSHIRAQSPYVTDLGAEMFGADGNRLANYTVAGISQKAALWFSNSVYPAYELGRFSADANGLYEWVLGAAEKHCDSCPQLAGQKHRLKHWHSRGLIPKAGILPCNGGCKCSLVRTTGRSQGGFI